MHTAAKIKMDTLYIFFYFTCTLYLANIGVPLGQAVVGPVGLQAIV